LNKVSADLSNFKAKELMSRICDLHPESTLRYTGADAVAQHPTPSVTRAAGRGVISIRDILKFRVAMLEEYSSTLERAKRNDGGKGVAESQAAQKPNSSPI